jgi:hypothetical protein
MSFMVVFLPVHENDFYGLVDYFMAALCYFRML